MPLWFSVIPLLLSIILAVTLHEIIPGLAAALLVGGYLLAPTLTGGLAAAVQAAINQLRNPVNLQIMAFLYLFGGFTGMMERAGGISGFAKLTKPYVKTRLQGVIFTWVSLVFSFLTPTFRVVTIGPLLRSLGKQLDLSRLDTAYLLDVTSFPTIILLPAGTAYTGFMLSVVAGALTQAHLQTSTYRVFLQGVLFNFFGLSLVATGLFVTLSGMDFTSLLSSVLAPLGSQEATPGSNQPPDRGDQPLDQGDRPLATRAASKQRLYRDEQLVEQALQREQQEAPIDHQPHVWNIVFPVLVLLVTTATMLISSGYHRGARSLGSALVQADASWVLLLSITATIILSFVFYALRGLPLADLVEHFFAGGNNLVQPIVLLALVWAIADVSTRLGFPHFVSQVFSGHVPALVLPAFLFLGGGLIAYFLGSSWATWALLMPLGVSLATGTGANLPLVVGSVFASGTVGDFAAPVAGVTTAAVLDVDPLEHARNKLPTALVAAALSTLLYLLFAWPGL